MTIDNYKKVRGPADASNFDTYPKEKESPPDELSGWDVDFQLCNWWNQFLIFSLYTLLSTYYTADTYTHTQANQYSDDIMEKGKVLGASL